MMYQNLVNIENKPPLAEFISTEVKVTVPFTGMNRQLIIEQLESQRGKAPYKPVPINLGVLFKTRILEITTNFETGRIESSIEHKFSHEDDQKQACIEVYQLSSRRIRLIITINNKNGKNPPGNIVNVILKINDVAQGEHLAPVIKIESKLVSACGKEKSHNPRSELGTDPNFLFCSERLNQRLLYLSDESTQAKPFSYVPRVEKNFLTFNHFEVLKEEIVAQEEIVEQNPKIYEEGLNLSDCVTPLGQVEDGTNECQHLSSWDLLQMQYQ